MKLNWGYSIILFFIVFCSLMIGFIIFSLRQNNDLVTDDYYEKGAGYTGQLEMNSRSAIYNDSIQLASQNQLIVVRFAKSFKLNSDSILIYFYRPSDKKFDYSLQSLLRSDSITIEKKWLVKGRYTVKFEWMNRQKSYQVEKDFFIQ